MTNAHIDEPLRSVQSDRDAHHRTTRLHAIAQMTFAIFGLSVVAIDPWDLSWRSLATVGLVSISIVGCTALLLAAATAFLFVRDPLHKA